MHLILAELARRCAENRCERALNAEATALRRWYQQQYPNAASPTVRTIENSIRGDHRKWVADYAAREATKL
jgi:hypothetical protein